MKISRKYNYIIKLALAKREKNIHNLNQFLDLEKIIKSNKYKEYYKLIDNKLIENYNNIDEINIRFWSNTISIYCILFEEKIDKDLIIKFIQYNNYIFIDILKQKDNIISKFIKVDQNLKYIDYLINLILYKKHLI